MSDLQQIEYLKGRIHQLEEQLRLERSSYKNRLCRIQRVLSGNTTSLQNMITDLRSTVGTNGKHSEVLFSSLWVVRD